MKKKSVIFFSIYLVVLIAIIFVVIYFFHISLLDKEKAGVDDFIKRIDWYLSSGYSQKAKQDLSRVIEMTKSSFNLLKILKRMYLLAGQTGDWVWFSEYSFRAWKVNKGNKDLRLLAAWGAIKANNINFLKQLVTANESVMRTFLAEAYLRNKKDFRIELTKVSELGRLTELVSSRDPEIFRELAAESGDQRLYLDAMLLYLYQGQAEQALALAQEQNTELISDEFLGLLYYDNGNLKEAISSMEKAIKNNLNRADLVLLLADFYLLAEQYQSAENLYRYVWGYTPAYFNNAAINLLYLAQTRQEADSVSEIIEFVLHKGQDNVEFVQEAAKYYLRAQELPKAQAILNKYREKDPDNYMIKLLLLLADKGGLLSEAYENRLWELYEQAPQDAALCRYITSYFIRKQNYKLAASALERYRQQVKDPEAAWQKSLNALIQALAGHTDAALRLYAELLATQEDSMARFNLAVLLVRKGDYGQALVDLKVALTQNVSVKFKAEIHTVWGYALEQQGLKEEAMQEYAWALQLDPSNIQAREFRNKLAISMQK